MSTFKIKWPDGKEETVKQSDCQTVGQFINCRFCSSKTQATVEKLKTDKKSA